MIYRILIVALVACLIITNTACEKNNAGEDEDIASALTLNIIYESNNEPSTTGVFDIKIFNTNDSTLVYSISLIEVPNIIKLYKGEYLVEIEYMPIDPQHHTGEYYSGNKLFSMGKKDIELDVECINVTSSIHLEFSDILLSDFINTRAVIVSDKGDSIFFDSNEDRKIYIKAGSFSCYSTTEYTNSNSLRVSKKIRSSFIAEAGQDLELMIDAENSILNPGKVTQNRDKYNTKHSYDQSYQILFTEDLPDFSYFTDSKDGQIYEVVCIDTIVWMADNYNYPVEGYMQNANWKKESPGGYYTWQMAMDNPPEGWHVPSKEEWTALFSYFYDYTAYYDGRKAFLALADGGYSCVDFLLSGSYSAYTGLWHEYGDAGYYWANKEECDANGSCQYSCFGFTEHWCGNTDYRFSKNVNNFFSIKESYHSVRYVIPLADFNTIYRNF